MKPLAFILLVLVGSLILTNLPPPSYADPNLDTLLRIATQARDNINIQLSQLPTVPDEINQLYKQGSEETDALAQSVSQEDQDSAKQHFLSAMKIFKTINDKISSLTPATSEQPSQIDTVQLKGEINRMQKLGDRLKTIATKNNVEIDFTKFDGLIQDATQNLDAGNADQVNKDLGTANQFLLDAHHILADAAIKKTSDRARNFTEKQIERFSQVKEASTLQNVTRPYPLPTPVPVITNTNQTENTHDMIVKLRQLVSEGKIDDALKLIKLIEALQSQEIRPQVPTTETPNATQPTNANNVNTPKTPNQVNSTTIPKQESQTIPNQVNSTTVPHQENSTTIPKQESQTIPNQVNSTTVPHQENSTQTDTVNSVNATQKANAVNDNPHHNYDEKRFHDNKDHEKRLHEKRSGIDSENKDKKKIRIDNSQD